MKTQQVKRQLMWLPMLLIVWNIIDIVVHIAVNQVEPLRVTGNIVGMLAALFVLLRVTWAYTPYLLGLSAVIIVGLNAVESFQHGFAPPMLVFIGVSVFLTLRMAQVTLTQPDTSQLYQRWWIAILATLVGIGVVVLVGEPRPPAGLATEAAIEIVEAVNYPHLAAQR